MSCSDATECGNIATWAGDLLVSRGDLGSALSYYDRAAREAPTEARFRTLATVASKLGFHGQAVSALEKALKLHSGRDETLEGELARERGLTLSRVVK
jgi:Flp pilus assembly protein TadD